MRDALPDPHAEERYLVSTQRLARQLDLRTLELFLSVVETGSFTEAAVREHLVVSAVSRRIAALERLVGAKLVERRRGGVAITSAGRELALRASEVELVLSRLLDGLEAHRKGLRGEVRLYASTSALLDRLPASIASFLDVYPEVNVHLKECDSFHVMRGVRDGHAHIGIYSSYARGPRLRAYPYFDNQLVIVTSAKHPLAKSKAVSFDEALRYDFVSLQDGDALSSLLGHLQTFAQRRSKTMRIRIKAASMGTSCRLIEAGVGIAVLPATTARLFAGCLDISTTRLRDSWASIHTVVGCRNEEALPPAARRLFDHLRSH